MDDTTDRSRPGAPPLLVLAAAACAIAACAGAPGGSAPERARRAPRPGPTAAARYKVDVSPGATEILVRASLPAGSSPVLGVDRDAEPFVRDVALVNRGEESEPVARRGSAWSVPSCEERGCDIRYRFLLADAASSIGDYGVASEHGGVLLSPPSSWLLRPLRAASTQPFRFRVSAPFGVSFVTGVFPAEDGEPDTYAAEMGDLPDAPFSAFGPVRRSTIRVPGGEVEIGIVPGELSEPDDVIVAWVKNAAETVSSYYGKLPIKRALVLILPTDDDDGVGYARTLGSGGASIVAPLGRGARKGDLEGDWVMTHEMVHLAFPNVPRSHLWLEEGLATYVEPIARARLGKLSVEKVWRDLARGLPKGLPGPGDRGLDFTPTWGRTYWGGALYCLLADVAIRERTGGARSLDDALRAIVNAGGTAASRWPLDRALSEGDRATGVPVLRELHAKLGLTPVSTDINELFARLGVRVTRAGVSFDDGAPLASIRRAITAPSTQPSP